MVQRLTHYLFSTLLVIIVIGGSLLLLMTSRSYDQFIASSIGFARVGESLAVRDAIHGYFLYGTPLTTMLFTVRELVHMADVRNLVESLRIMVAVAIGLFIVLGATLRWSREDWMQVIRRAAFVLLGAFMLIILIVYNDFDSAFVYVHEHIFTNDFWLLDPAQHALIRAYPGAYFSTFVLYWWGGLVGLAVVTLIATYSSRQPRRR